MLLMGLRSLEYFFLLGFDLFRTLNPLPETQCSMVILNTGRALDVCPARDARADLERRTAVISLRWSVY